MKKLLNKMKSFKSMKTLASQAGQGATEYILMLAVLIAVVFLAKGKIKEFVEKQMGSASTASESVWQ